jgi:tagatose 1,6-diphosphate aldolase
MRSISIGKYRGLQQCATSRGALAVLALDHRNSLHKALKLDASAPETGTVITALKRQIVEVVGPAATALLLDPIYGAAQVVATGVLPREVGLTVALEASGYTGDPTARDSQILQGWSVAKAKRMGADAVKLLVYYHPEAPTARAIQELVMQVAEACDHHDIVFFLETLSYSLDPAAPKLVGDELRRVVVETAAQLTPLGADVLKTEFPLAASVDPQGASWAEACAELSGASTIPWILLSAGVDYETYLRQIVVACQSGASGVAAGRAVWQEVTALTGADRGSFLKDVARARMARITALCDALARPWTELLAPVDLSTAWYQDYPDS